MSNPNSNGTHVTPGGILLTESALDQARAQRMAKAQRYLNEIATNLTIEVNAQNMVVAAAIQKQGLPAPEEAEKFVAAAIAVADALSKRQIVRKYEGIRSTLEHLNMRLPDASPVLEHGARTYGVDPGRSVVAELPPTASPSSH